MFVCRCVVVTDREIDAAVDCGARDECAIARFCGAGSVCGGCLPVVRSVLRRRGLCVDHRATVDEVRVAVGAG